MVTIIKSEIELYDCEEGRKTPFITGYRPLFNIKNQDVVISGQIILIDREIFQPGDKGVVEIRFLSKFLNEDFGPGSTFIFSEGIAPLGEGIVKEVL